MNKHLEELNDKVIKEAIKHIDVESMGKKMAAKLQAEIEGQFDREVSELDLAYWIQDELTDKKTASGKKFHSAMNKIAARMIDNINPEVVK